MSSHSPEVVLLPEPDPDSEFNTFIAAEVRARVDWTRIHELLEGRKRERRERDGPKLQIILGRIGRI